MCSRFSGITLTPHYNVFRKVTISPSIIHLFSSREDENRALCVLLAKSMHNKRNLSTD